MRSRRQRGDPVGTQPGQRLGTGRLRQRHRKQGAGAGPDDVRIVNIGAFVANDQAVDAGRIGRTQNAAQIARFFDRFRHQVQTIRPHRNIRQRMPFHLRHRNQPFRPVAVSHFGQQERRNFEQLHPGGRQGLQQRIFIAAQEHFRSEKTLRQLQPVLPGPSQFPVAFQHRQLLFFAVAALPQPADMFDGGVAGAGYPSDIHKISFPKKIASCSVLKITRFRWFAKKNHIFPPGTAPGKLAKNVCGGILWFRNIFV